MIKTVYLTGAPGSGKTTALDGLQAKLTELTCWKYSERLAAHIAKEGGDTVDHSTLRRRSAGLVTPADITAVDNALATFVASNRATTHVLIDSHPVTKEAYGFRSTAFTTERLLSLSLDEMWVTYVDADTTLSRIDSAESGRQAISLGEAAMHTSLQASVAIQYGIITGRPVYFFDTSAPPEEVVARMIERLQK